MRKRVAGVNSFFETSYGPNSTQSRAVAQTTIIPKTAYALAGEGVN